MPIGTRGWRWFGPKVLAASPGMKAALVALGVFAAFCYAFLGPLVFDAAYWVLGKIARTAADRRLRIGISVAFVVVYLVAVSLAGSTAKTTGAGASSSPVVAANASSPAAITATGTAATPLPTPTPAPATPTPAPTATPVPTATPSPTAAPTPVLDFQPISLSGSGSKVPKFTIPEGVAAIATITNKGGGSNFAVWSLAADGSKLDLLVNVIGNYSGTVIFDTTSGQHSVAFSVDSSGSWTITVKPLQLARSWDSVSKLSGTGDDVILLQAPISGLTTATLTNAGSGNFAVWAYSATSGGLLVNEIGSYNGEVQLPSGTMLLVINSNGAWTVTPQ
jgi:hypothetical protein